MTALEQLEALNPVPDQRGNPGEPQRKQSRRLRFKPALMVAAAAAVVVLGGVAIGNRTDRPVDVDMAAQPATATPQPTAVPVEPAPTANAEAQLAPPPVDLLGVDDTADAVARLVIPAIDVDHLVLSDVSPGALRRGLGHEPTTAFPGQAGNASIAGHRTTFGAPFHRLDELEVGDSILVSTVQGFFEYTVGHEQLIVDPGDLSVLDDVGDNRLTLTTSHPKYSSRQRLVVVADLVGEPAPAITFVGFPMIDVTGLSANDRQPYFSFIGDEDALRSARGFLTSQFPGWGDTVELDIDTQNEERAAVRWNDQEHGTAGWVLLHFDDGAHHVSQMTMDTVAASMHQSQTGGRGLIRAAEAGGVVEVLRPRLFSMQQEREAFSGDLLSENPLAVVELVGRLEAGSGAGWLVTFDVEPGDHFQETRMVVRNEDGDQIGGLASSLALPMINAIAVVTAAEDSGALRSFVHSQHQVLAGPLAWDRWQSVSFMAWLAPQFAPASVNEIPTHEVTMLALRPVGSVEQYAEQIELLEELKEFGEVIWVPVAPPDDTASSVSESPSLADISPADGYVIDELPSINLCEPVQASGWAWPKVVVNEDRRVFATPEEARDSVPQTSVGHTVEFRTTAGVVTGFARPVEFNPWWFQSLAVVEQVNGGWVLDRWERATC